ncbi:hypothetical protein [Thiorhodococcus minor]|uniref:VCBS repeat-containing protein n=1 Tax=Thiorhodococcus minor TaxID=57489 RepID=A0A6M0JSI2_9GAMM|nr:hypothetical protein [Thiorhodococcus minor]NEV60480.1 hypothetical protein [Thiorhodococcus minor]
MLTPTLVSGLPSSEAISRLDRHPATQDRQRPPASGAEGSLPASSGEVVDLTEDIARRVEQDLDYQILRKTFALDQAAVASGTRHPEGESMEEVRAGAASLQLDASRGAAVAVEGKFDAELSLSWEWSASLEMGFSLGVGDSELDSSRSRIEQARVALDFSIGEAAEVQLGDPLVLDLGGGGIQTTGFDDGVAFDLDGDGRLDQMSSVAGDTWLLALDRSENGRIDDGTELFGDQTGAANGFDALARHDGNGDGRIDASDGVFSQLRLLQIRDDGTQVTQTLTDAKVVSIELGYQSTRKALDVYDQVAQTSSFTREDGTRGEAADVLLAHRRGG